MKNFSSRVKVSFLNDSIENKGIDSAKQLTNVVSNFTSHKESAGSFKSNRKQVLSTYSKMGNSHRVLIKKSNIPPIAPCNNMSGTNLQINDQFEQITREEDEKLPLRPSTLLN